MAQVVIRGPQADLTGSQDERMEPGSGLTSSQASRIANVLKSMTHGNISGSHDGLIS